MSQNESISEVAGAIFQSVSSELADKIFNGENIYKPFKTAVDGFLSGGDDGDGVLPSSLINTTFKLFRGDSSEGGDITDKVIGAAQHFVEGIVGSGALNNDVLSNIGDFTVQGAKALASGDESQLSDLLTKTIGSILSTAKTSNADNFDLTTTVGNVTHSIEKRTQDLQNIEDKVRQDGGLNVESAKEAIDVIGGLERYPKDQLPKIRDQMSQEGLSEIIENLRSITSSLKTSLPSTQNSQTEAQPILKTGSGIDVHQSVEQMKDTGAKIIHEIEPVAQKGAKIADKVISNPIASKLISSLEKMGGVAAETSVREVVAGACECYGVEPTCAHIIGGVVSACTEGVISGSVNGVKTGIKSLANGDSFVDATIQAVGGTTQGIVQGAVRSGGRQVGGPVGEKVADVAGNYGGAVVGKFTKSATKQVVEQGAERVVPMLENIAQNELDMSTHTLNGIMGQVRELPTTTPITPIPTLTLAR